MSVGSLDMKSQRILPGYDDKKNSDNLKEELLKKQDDRKEKEKEKEKSNQGVTFQRWAAKILPVIASLSNDKCTIMNGIKHKNKNQYANVDRIIDLNSMLKSKQNK